MWQVSQIFYTIKNKYFKDFRIFWRSFPKENRQNLDSASVTERDIAASFATTLRALGARHLVRLFLSLTSKSIQIIIRRVELNSPPHFLSLSLGLRKTDVSLLCDHLADQLYIKLTNHTPGSADLVRLLSVQMQDRLWMALFLSRVKAIHHRSCFSSF